jgi:hypothetical protein
MITRGAYFGREVGMVVGRSDLDQVHSDEALFGDAAETCASGCHRPLVQFVDEPVGEQVVPEDVAAKTRMSWPGPLLSSAICSCTSARRTMRVLRHGAV